MSTGPRVFTVADDFLFPPKVKVSAGSIVETDNAKVLTAAERAKLTNFTSGVQNVVLNMLTAGEGVTLTPNADKTKLTVKSTGAGMDAEGIQDMMATFLKAGENVTLEYDDAAGKLTIKSSGGSATVTDQKIRDVIRDTITDGTNTSVSYSEELQKLRINVGTPGGDNGSSPYSDGFIRADDDKWGLTPWDADAPVLNDFSAIIAESKATGRWIRVDDVYAQSGTSFSGTNNWLDQDVLVFGKGKILSSGPVSIRAITPFSPEVLAAAGSIGTVAIGDPDDIRTVTSTMVGAVELQKFKAGMVWQYVAKPISNKVETPKNRSGFYPWSLPGTTPNGLTGTTVMAEAMTVLGVTYTYTASATKLTENTVVVGQTSGAMMVIASALGDLNGIKDPNDETIEKRRITTEQVFGTFADKEKLRKVTMSEDVDMHTVAGRAKVRAASANATDMGTIDANGVVAFTDSLLGRFENLTCPVYLRKQGGSRGGYTPTTEFPVGDYFSNLRFHIDGITFGTITDGSEFKTARGPQVYLANFVEYRISNATIQSSYRDAFQIVSCYNGLTSDLVINMLPNNAVQANDGYGNAFGYGLQYLGSSAYCFLDGARFTNCRHGVTQNSSANSQFLDAIEDTMKHGTQKYLVSMNCVATNCVSAAYDTHYGAQFTMWINCYGFSNRGEGRTDSGGAIFSNRSWNTRHINCHSVGGVFGFSDATAGFRTGIEEDGFDSRFPSETLYQDCTARGYQQYGFRQGLRSQSAEHSVRWVNCWAEDRRLGGSAGGGGYDTCGWLITGIDATLDGCGSGSQNYAAVRYIPGSYISAAETPAVPIPGSLKVLGGFYANQAENVTTTTSVFAISGSTSASLMVLEVASDIVVNPRRKTGTPTRQAIRAVEGLATIRWGGTIKTIGGTSIRDIRSTGGTITHELMAGASPAIHYGAKRPRIVYAGRVWAETDGHFSTFDGTKWMSNGAVREITLASDPDLLGAYKADTLATTSALASWAPYAGEWGPYTQTLDTRQPAVVANAVNGHKAVVFDKSSLEFMDLQYDDIESPTTTLMVAKVENVQGAPILASITSGTGRGAMVSAQANRISITANGTPGGFPSTRDYVEEWRIYALVWDGKKSRLYDCSKTPINGELDVNTRYNVMQSSRLGRGSGGSTTYANIQVAEQITLDRAATNDEIDQYLEALSGTYSIPLVTGIVTPTDPTNPTDPTTPTDPETPWTPSITPWLGAVAQHDGDSSGQFAGDATTLPEWQTGIDYPREGVWPRLIGTGWTNSDPSNAKFPKGINRIGTNRHVGSSTTPDVAMRLLMNKPYQNIVRKWRPGVLDLVTMLCGGNDVGHFHTLGARGMNVYKNGLGTLVGIYRSREFIYTTAANERGTWVEAPLQYGDRTMMTVTPGSSVDIYFPGTNATLVMLAPHDGSGSSYTTKLDSQAAVSRTTKNNGNDTELATSTDARKNAGTKHTPVPVQFLNMTPGSHKVTITHTGSQGDPLLVEVLLPWYDDPAKMPLAIFVAPGKSTDLGYSRYKTDPKPDNAAIDRFRGYFNDVMGQFGDAPNLAIVPTSEIDRAMPYNAMSRRINDGLHPNGLGHRWIASIVLTVIMNTRRLKRT